MLEHGQKLHFVLGLLITFKAYYALAQEKGAFVEPYWEERTLNDTKINIRLNEFEEFPVNEGSPTFEEFPSPVDGK